MVKRLSNKKYVKFVNAAVKKGKHNRPIRIVLTKNKPTTEGKTGVATHINMKKFDRIAVWKGLVKNKEEQIRRSKMLGRKVITRDQAVRHELWHIHKPYESEKNIKSLEGMRLPKRLPVRRRM